ncbi:hypothetical protein NAEGRDRAFT_80827 [Naegleria gruberi]|uniref:Protein kinase domain-containing protein n=1 Tax=Naegleria gruberi TaxID=5762 RepID=D2VPY1_NAEGR|nr:uncharacterized protein NAEGRDRAFT_80827 [Naegleria gruberi]EFC41083.1 hypothetical protein NAEGRDRAFT_80827 [Naegleria gruberi]|eukprot:XP_002673827.1 hypothetical protein NAEGRDRAFT_80827 [Naegleria gruberi strain NEG-M]
MTTIYRNETLTPSSVFILLLLVVIGPSNIISISNYSLSDYISPFDTNYKLPSFLSADKGYSNAEVEVTRLLNMAQYSKVMEYEICKTQREESIFSVNCLSLDFEYTFSNVSSTLNSTISFSSMKELINYFTNEIEYQIGNVPSVERPGAIIYMKINVESDIVSNNCQNNLKIQELTTNNLLRDIKLFIELESKINSTINCESYFIDYGETFDKAVTIFKGFNLQILQQNRNAFIENCTLKGGKFLGNYVIVQNSKISGQFETDAHLSLFKKVRYDFDDSRPVVEFKYEEISIFTESELSFFLDQFTLAATNMWFLNGTINIDKLVFIEEVKEIVMIGCLVNTKTSTINDGSLNILFSNVVRISHTIFGKSNGNIITIGESIEVQFQDCQFVGSQNTEGSIVTVRNSRNVIVRRCIFAHNRGSTGVLLLSNVVATYIVESTFTDNVSVLGGAILSSSLSSHKTLVTSSKFIRNRNGKTGGALSSYGSDIIVFLSEFIENYSSAGGGAISGIDSNIAIGESVFRSNTAKNSGGAILCSGNFSSYETLFVNNSVLTENITSSLMCSSTKCLGNGGALSFTGTGFHTKFAIYSSKFHMNRALRGGAISFNLKYDTLACLWEDVEISDNQADYSGGGIFFHKIVKKEFLQSNFTGNSALNYGGNIGSSIRQITWQVSKEINGKLSGDFEPMNGVVTLFPGQRFTLKPTSKDTFGNSVEYMWEVYSNSVSTDSITATIPKQTRVSEVVEGIFITVSERQFTQPIKASLTLSFFHANSDIPLEIIPCPVDYESTPATYGSESSFICKVKPNYESIIIVAVVASFFAFCSLLIILSGVGYGVYKLAKIIRYWRGRERAEKDIEKRLLENDIVDAQEDLRNSDDSSSKSGAVFIITLDKLFIEKKIGEGGSGVVFKGRWDHNTVAIKCLRVDVENYALRDDIEKEASLLCKLRHPNVLMFYGISITPKKHYLVVEYLEKGSIENLISQCRKGEISLDLISKLSLLIDVACGMEYLHSLKPPIIHRDLKPGNILLDSNNTAKVCDFGLSRLMNGNNQTNTTTGMGTLFYIAPELLDSELSHTSSTLAPSIDVFSFAIIMYELFFEENPYIHTKNTKITQARQNEVSPFTVLPRVLKGERPVIPFSNDTEMDSYLSSYVQEYDFSSSDVPLDRDQCKERFRNIVGEFIKLMTQCWNSDPKQRPSFTIISTILSSLKSRLIIEGQ